MNQEQFEQRHEAEWSELEQWLALERRPAADRRKQPAVFDEQEFTARYRRLAQHLALARERLYSPHLIDRLAHLAHACHNRLYGQRSHLGTRVARFYLHTLPRTVRAEWRLIALSALLFFGPLIGMLVAIQYQPELAYSVVGDEQIQGMEKSYGPGGREEREAEAAFVMLGFYVSNNTGIGFRTFAGGLLFGIGSLMILLFNGLVIGAVAGHVTHLGYVESFWGFVAGHSAPELSAIVLSGAAGFRLGWALIAPGRMTRLHALREAGRTSIKLVYGAATLFFLAAFVEAFWSPLLNLPVALKYAVGIAGWPLLWWYLLFTGRPARAH